MLEPGRIEATDLGRHFKISSGQGRSLKATLLRREASTIHEFWALRHINLEVEPGETFGIIGRNGSGKSTFLKLLARIYGPSEGSCRVGGRISSLLELGAGFHYDFNAIENIFLAGAIYGIPKKELEKSAEEIISFAELEQFAYQPIKTYSSGMFMRLGFSVAMHVRPDVLLLDEVLAVGDERFMQKCLSRIAQFRREGGTMLLVTHDPGTVQRLCTRAMLLDKGNAIQIGTSSDVLETYHERLAAHDNHMDHAEPRGARYERFDAKVTVINQSGEQHHQFVEGEPFAVRILVTPKVSVTGATIELRLHDELGREIGGRSLNGLAFAAGQARTVEFHTDATALRNGLFQVHVSLSETALGSLPMDIKAIETLSIYGQKTESSGPIQLGGHWTLD